MNVLMVITNAIVMRPALMPTVITAVRVMLVILEMDIHALKLMNVKLVILVMTMRLAQTPWVHINVTARYDHSNVPLTKG